MYQISGMYHFRLTRRRWTNQHIYKWIKENMRILKKIWQSRKYAKMPKNAFFIVKISYFEAKFRNWGHWVGTKNPWVGAGVILGLFKWEGGRGTENFEKNWLKTPVFSCWNFNFLNPNNPCPSLLVKLGLNSRPLKV